MSRHRTTRALVSGWIQRKIRTVEVVALIVEPPDSPPAPIRVSLRSKSQIDVAAFAQQFGGGGHARAAGLKLDNTTLPQANEKIATALLKA